MTLSSNDTPLVKFSKNVDWLLLLFLAPILAAGLITMKSFSPLEAAGGHGTLFTHQLIWIGISLGMFIFFSYLDLRFLKRTDVLVTLFLGFSLLLLVLFGLGSRVNGSQSWFDLGAISLQPADMMKLVLILILSKYFSRRHIAIAQPRHIFISGLYALIPFGLVLLQPDFGSAIIFFLIWLGMALVSGISKKHLMLVFAGAAAVFFLLWILVFAPYQKARILTFIHPLTDIHGTGYNAYQSTIAVGSGQFLGKGVGFGTQSRLQFLPEYETDFIFSAFAEEWGFVGVILVFILFGLVVYRILSQSLRGGSNFEMLFGMGVAIFFMSHFIINVGMNIGLLPVTGITLPFMSYGGSHLLAEFTALGILSGMRRQARNYHPDDLKQEFLGI